ncbi:hypothetical protein [Dictyobacter arantiisoli]|uniref:Uncharacterized protein n=1 Tax=Dictyobacter arantiisoli TaxID=2014874 RepID=A0A5A5TAG2_9CHLR|nr:hypothetical protein [Dictyobacter arantiisoli]GCF08500.1 hypothetical protein KDI_20640 [Dictyobacter arantiisoli]
MLAPHILLLLPEEMITAPWEDETNDAPTIILPYQSDFYGPPDWQGVSQPEKRLEALLPGESSCIQSWWHQA